MLYKPPRRERYECSYTPCGHVGEMVFSADSLDFGTQHCPNCGGFTYHYTPFTKEQIDELADKIKSGKAIQETSQHDPDRLSDVVDKLAY